MQSEIYFSIKTEVKPLAFTCGEYVTSDSRARFAVKHYQTGDVVARLPDLRTTELLRATAYLRRKYGQRLTKYIDGVDECNSRMKNILRRKESEAAQIISVESGSTTEECFEEVNMAYSYLNTSLVARETAPPPVGTLVVASVIETRHPFLSTIKSIFYALEHSYPILIIPLNGASLSALLAAQFALEAVSPADSISVISSKSPIRLVTHIENIDDIFLTTSVKNSTN